MQSAIKLILIFSFILLTSCFFGPVKELKFQIEDSFEDEIDNEKITQLVEIANEINYEIIWEQNVGESISKNFKIAHCKNLIFSGEKNGYIHTINAIDGKILWKKNIGQTIIAGTACDNKNFYFVTADGFVWAVDHFGQNSWKTFIGQIFSVPMVQEESIFLKTSGNTFYSLNALNGKLNWMYQAQVPPLTIKSWGEMNYANEILYAGLPGGKCLALNSNNGSLIWESTFSPPEGSSDIDRANDVTSQPIIDEYFIYIVSSTGKVASVDKKNGSVIWSRNLSSFYGLSFFSNNHLIVTHNAGALYLLDKNDGKVSWRNGDYLGRDIKRGTPYLENHIYGDYEGYIHFINRNSGKTTGRLKINNASIIDNLAEDNFLYVMDKAANIYKLKISLNSIQQDSYEDENMLQNESNLIQQNDASDNSLLDDLIFWD